MTPTTLLTFIGYNNTLIKLGNIVTSIKDSCNKIGFVTRINRDGTVWTSNGRGDMEDFKLIKSTKS